VEVDRDAADDAEAYSGPDQRQQRVAEEHGAIVALAGSVVERGGRAGQLR